MSTITASDRAIEEVSPETVVSKVWRRLIPFLFLLYVINYLDRINIGFAALSMNKDLLLSATAFGLANTIFYIGYVAFEIPSNLLMVRYGARVWLARILMSWGLASAGTMLVVGPNSLYVVRFLVGLLEAGFVPGVLLYLTYWIPSTHRARANGYLMMAQPVAMALGGSVSGLILEHFDGTLGLKGWQWLFLLEGLPAVFLGLLAYVYLTDNPRKAGWLVEGEKNVLADLLVDSGSVRSPRPQRSILKQLTEPSILLLAAAYFCLVNTLNANATWIPTVVREVMKSYPLTAVGLVSAIPAVCAIAIMPVWTRNSDRTRERTNHLLGALAMAAVGWLMVIYCVQPWLRLGGLAFTVTGAFCAMSVFWTLPQAILSEAARPAGIGLISAIGLLGSAASPAVIGILKDLTGTFTSGLVYVTILLLVSMVLTGIVSRRHHIS